jgi:hypothetical protein
VTCGQCMHLMKTTCSGAKGLALFTMEFLEVKIKLSRVLRIGSEIVPGARRLSNSPQQRFGYAECRSVLERRYFPVCSHSDRCQACGNVQGNSNKNPGIGPGFSLYFDFTVFEMVSSSLKNAAISSSSFSLEGRLR